MKKTLVTFTLFWVTFQINSQEKVNWLSFEKSIELNKKNPKPILIDIYTDWWLLQKNGQRNLCKHYNCKIHQ